MCEEEQKYTSAQDVSVQITEDSLFCVSCKAKGECVKLRNLMDDKKNSL